MKLTAVVPIYGPTYILRQQYIARILEASVGIKVILICDSFDEEIKRIFQEWFLGFESKDIEILYGDYGNPGSSRNAALELVSSDWFCFWDSDDEPNPPGYLGMIQKAEANGFKIAKGKYETSTHQTETSTPIIEPVRLCKNLIRQTVDPGLWRYVFSHQTYGELRFPGLRMGEDQDYLVQALIKGEEIYFEEAVVYSYRIGFNSQLTNNPKSFEDLNESLSFLTDIYRKNSHNPDMNVLIIVSYLKQIYSAMARRKFFALQFLSWANSKFFLSLFLQGKLFRPIYILLDEKVRK